jgi:hypothetical protein
VPNDPPDNPFDPVDWFLPTEDPSTDMVDGFGSQSWDPLFDGFS